MNWLEIKTFLSHSWLGRNFDFTALVVVLLIFGLGGFVYSAELLDLVSSEAKKYDTIEHYVFNNPLVLAALLGFPILIKRLSVMQEQIEKSQRQVGIGQQQTRTAQYNAANELLWSSNLGSRMAGIQALWRVAKTYPKEEYHNVMDVFTQFIKHPLKYITEKGDEKKQDKFLRVGQGIYSTQKEVPAGKRDDISEILRLMVGEKIAGAKSYDISLSGTHLEGAYLHRAHLERAYLMGTYLKGADFFGARLEGAHLEGARLEGADFFGALLERVHLNGAHLKGTDFFGTHLEGANLFRANFEAAHLRLTIINEANFAEATDLTQEQVNGCVFITDHTRFTGKPQFPKGFKHTYRNLSFKEWKKEKDELLS